MVGRKRWAFLLGAVALFIGATLQPRSGRQASVDERGAGILAEVQIRTFRYRPAVLEVAVGSRVSWNNQDDILHTVTSGVPGEPDGRFDSSLEGAGSAYSFTFDEPGTYDYFCARHEFMRGQVIVSEPWE